MVLCRFLLGVALLSSCCFGHQASSAELPRLLTERAIRDFDAMLDARVIRALVVRSKTGYFFDAPKLGMMDHPILEN